MEIRQKDGKLKLFEMKVEDIKPKTKATSRRASEIEYFVAALDGEQIKARKKPYGAKLIAIRLAHVSTDDLYPFFKRCMAYEKEGKGSFGKCFFGSLKVKAV